MEREMRPGNSGRISLAGKPLRVGHMKDPGGSKSLPVFEIRYGCARRNARNKATFELQPTVMLGYALLIAWTTILTWSPECFLASPLPDSQARLLQTVLFAAIAAFSLLAIPLAPLFSSERGRTLLAACAMASLIVSVCCSRIAVEPPIGLAAAWACAGIASSCLVILWGRIFTLVKRKSLIMSTSCSFMLAGLLFALVSAMPAPMTGAVTLSFPLLSFALFNLAWKSRSAGLIALHSRSESSDNVRQPARLDVAVSATCNLTMGFVTATASSQHFGASVPAFGGTAVAVAGMLSLACLFKTSRNPSYYFARLLPPYAAVMLALMGVCPPPAGGIAAVSLVVGLCLADLINTSNVSKNASGDFNAYARLFGQDLGFSRLAYAIGWIGGSLALALPALEGDLSKPCLVVLAIVLAGFAFSNFLGIDRHAFVAHGSVDSEKPFDPAASKTELHDRSSTPPTFVTNTAGKDDGALQAIPFPRPDDTDEATRIDHTLVRVIERYELSRKEAETLAYLIRGRNATHIAKKLFVSTNTVKSHMRKIYGKLGVHSQQELIDFIEGYPEDA